MKKIIKSIRKFFGYYNTIGYCTGAEEAKTFKAVFDTIEFEKV